MIGLRSIRKPKTGISKREGASMQRSESYICPETPSSLLGKGGFCRLRAVLRQSALCGVGPLLVAGLVACFSFSVEAAAPTPGAACTEYGESSSSCYKNGCYICSGGVWVAQALQIGASSASCTTGLAGMLRWTGSSLEQCNGSAWTSLGGSAVAAFGFTNQTGVQTNTTVTSNAITLSGFTGAVAATCGAGCLSIIRNGSAVGSNTSVVAGDTLAITQKSSSAANTTTTASVVVGTTASSPWSVTTGSSSYPATKSVFNATGADQSYVVPAGVTRLRFKMWGAGAPGDALPTTAQGSAGGFTTGELAVTPGETLTLVVGKKGVVAGHTTTYGGGGSVAGSYSASGGGRTAIRRGTTELVTAGGAGGGGNTDIASTGVGGGLSGGAGGASAYDGGGGTQAAGGAGGSGASNAGTAFQGGASYDLAGGGGGGYFGGGSGGYYRPGETTWVGPGGGGSGYIGGAVADGTQSITASTIAGSGRTPPQTSDSDYTNNAGYGGSLADTGVGDGLLVIW